MATPNLFDMSGPDGSTEFALMAGMLTVSDVDGGSPTMMVPPGPSFAVSPAKGFIGYKLTPPVPPAGNPNTTLWWFQAPADNFGTFDGMLAQNRADGSQLADSVCLDPAWAVPGDHLARPPQYKANPIAPDPTRDNWIVSDPINDPGVALDWSGVSAELRGAAFEMMWPLAGAGGGVMFSPLRSKIVNSNAIVG